MVLEALLAIGVVVLFGVTLGSVAPLLLATGAATVGLAATGTLYGVLAAGLRVRETLVPVLLLPVVSPVLLGATRAWEAAIDGVPGDAWPWVGILSVFAALAVGIGHARVRAAAGGSVRGEAATLLKPAVGRRRRLGRGRVGRGPRVVRSVGRAAGRGAG